jgi:hypothetical protein
MKFEKGFTKGSLNFGWSYGDLYRLNTSIGKCGPMSFKKLVKSKMNKKRDQEGYCILGRKYSINQLMAWTVDIDFEFNIHKDFPKI